jgi:HK97 family phage portal protein
MGLTRRIANTLARTETRSVDLLMGGLAASAYDMGWGHISLEEGEGRWSASSAAYRSIQAIATNAASLAVQVRETRDDTTVEGHWLTQLWERPNELWSRNALAQVIWGQLETRGRSFVYVKRAGGGAGKPQELWPIFGGVKPVIAGREKDNDQGVEEILLGYQVYVGGKRIGLLPNEVLWLRYPHPTDPWGCLSPLGAAGHAVELDAYARAWQRNEFKNGAKPKHVVYLGDLDQPAFNAAVETWKSQVEGVGNAGKSLLLAGKQPTKADRITLTPEEMSWLDSRRASWEEILVAFGVPKDYLLGGATYENRQASKVTLWSDTIVPKLETVAGEMARQLLVGEPNRRVRFDTDDVEALQEGADAKAKRATDLTAHDVIVLDEARAEMGLDPLPNGLGQLTLTAYRILLQTTAQQAILDGQQPADRASLLRLVAQTPGRALGNTGAPPLLLPSGIRKHGPSLDTILSEYDRHERVIVKAVARLAARQQAVVLTNADRLLKGKAKKAAEWQEGFLAAYLGWQAEVRAKVDELFDPKHWRKETAEALEASVGGAWESGASQIARSLGIDFDKFDLLVLQAMDARVEVLADQVTDTTRQVLQDRVLLQGVAQGESIDQLKARIRGVFSDLKSWRATMIARTETVGGFNGGSYVMAEASGVVVMREWGATDDTRTRETHDRIDGQRVKGFKTRYANGCLHPGDPTAKPEETIMCRCVEFYLTEE